MGLLLGTPSYLFEWILARGRPVLCLFGVSVRATGVQPSSWKMTDSDDDMIPATPYQISLSGLPFSSGPGFVAGVPCGPEQQPSVSSGQRCLSL